MHSRFTAILALSLAALAAPLVLADTPMVDSLPLTRSAACNCAYVELNDQAAELLRTDLLSISSVQFDVKTIHWRPGAGYSTLQVAAQSVRPFTPFDSAKLILEIAAQQSDWDVLWVSAFYDASRSAGDTLATSNVGSIGH